MGFRTRAFQFVHLGLQLFRPLFLRLKGGLQRGLLV